MTIIVMPNDYLLKVLKWFSFNLKNIVKIYIYILSNFLICCKALHTLTQTKLFSPILNRTSSHSLDTLDFFHLPIATSGPFNICSLCFGCSSPHSKPKFLPKLTKRTWKSLNATWSERPHMETNSSITCSHSMFSSASQYLSHFALTFLVGIVW